MLSDSRGVSIICILFFDFVRFVIEIAHSSVLFIDQTLSYFIQRIIHPTDMVWLGVEGDERGIQKPVLKIIASKLVLL